MLDFNMIQLYFLYKDFQLQIDTDDKGTKDQCESINTAVFPHPIYQTPANSLQHIAHIIYYSYEYLLIYALQIKLA